MAGINPFPALFYKFPVEQGYKTDADSGGLTGSDEVEKLIGLMGLIKEKMLWENMEHFQN